MQAKNFLKVLLNYFDNSKKKEANLLSKNKSIYY